MSAKLLPCPFCGGCAVLWAPLHGPGTVMGDDFTVACNASDCVGSVGTFITKEEAMAAWNRRTAALVTPAAYLHFVTADDGEPDQALSFTVDSFPLEGFAGYRKVSVQPLYTAAAVPGDCVVVPREPTEAMLVAAVKSLYGDATFKVHTSNGATMMLDEARDYYKAMLAAAGSPK